MEPKHLSPADVFGWYVAHAADIQALIQIVAKLFPTQAPAVKAAPVDLNFAPFLGWLTSPAGMAVIQTIIGMIPKKAGEPEVG